jgi:GMP synthase (glutamine-hydrolysing)
LQPQITVLDAGGQYCHLIARKVRELGVYAEVAPSETAASALTGRKGVVISGGPSSVYDPGSPSIDAALLASGIPVLGICYGQQLIAHLLGGVVQKGVRGEYGFAQLDVTSADTIRRRRPSAGLDEPSTGGPARRRIEALAGTDTRAVAAMGSAARRLMACSFILRSPIPAPSFPPTLC